MLEFNQLVKHKYVKLGYRFIVNNFYSILPVLIISSVIFKLIQSNPNEIISLWYSLNFKLSNVICSSIIIIFIAIFYIMLRPKTIYLVDYACFKPPDNLKFPSTMYMEQANFFSLNPKDVEFQKKILEKSGLGEETYLPLSFHHIPPLKTMNLATEEAELIIFTVMDSLFKKTNIKPKDIDILIVNCSVFAPTTSLSTMVINKYKMGSNIKSFNLSGMGCSAGIISIGLARDLLKVHPNSNVVVISTEITSNGTYLGKERAMILANCLFRMGGAAILLSNKRVDRNRAKYRLSHVVRTHKAVDDKGYKCVFQEEDPEGIVGINLSKDVMEIAGEALKINITTIGPLVLPTSEQLLFLITLIGKKIFKLNMKPYIPDFKQAFEHFCIHAGGRAVIDELQKKLELSDEHVEASRMTLQRFGNTSSSSLWYELSYIEAKGRMKKGDRVWQIGLGSGFKCNSAVWKSNRSIKASTDGPWVDFTDFYPVHTPEVVKL